jgi:hypothetical protein
MSTAWSFEWDREMHIELDQIHFEITARAGKKAGTWTRPDITAGRSST